MTLERRTPMKRSPMKRTTKQMARSPIKHKAKKGKAYDNDFSEDVKAQALRRAGGCCEFPGCLRRSSLHHHHRMQRSSGGKGTLENDMVLCADHHAYVHANRSESYDRGWLIHAWGA